MKPPFAGHYKIIVAGKYKYMVLHGCKSIVPYEYKYIMLYNYKSIVLCKCRYIMLVLKVRAVFSISC